MKATFIESFTDEASVYSAFQEEPGKEKILFAWYGNGDYCGSAFVLIEQDGKLYEINASHCSCYGLEGQWSPEETTVKDLEYRMVQGTLGHGHGSYDGEDFAEELADVLKAWKRKNSRKPKLQ